jgi:hypothetical protein
VVDQDDILTQWQGGYVVTENDYIEKSYVHRHDGAFIGISQKLWMGLKKMRSRNVKD